MSCGVPSLISQFCCGCSRTRLALLLLPVLRGVDRFFMSGLFIWTPVHFPASGELIHLFLLWFSTPSWPLYRSLQCTALCIYWPWSSYRMVCPLTCYSTQSVSVFSNVRIKSIFVFDLHLPLYPMALLRRPLWPSFCYKGVVGFLVWHC